MQDPNSIDENTLPRPELNPLLNPLLASHMGRWAEVYFTNPPEKREQAVLELLRELESKSGAGATTQPAAEPVREEERTVGATRTFPQSADSSNVCSLCGHRNRRQQWFCGMCGGRLSEDNAEAEDSSPSESSVIRGFTDSSEYVSPAVQQIINESAESYPALPEFQPGPPISIPPPPEEPLDAAPSEPDWPQLRNDFAGFRVQAEPVTRPWRLYVAAGVALLLSLLLYEGWRGNKQTSGSAAQEFPSSAQPSTQSLPATQPTAPSSQPAPSAAPPVNSAKEQPVAKPPASPKRPPATRPNTPSPAVAQTTPATISLQSVQSGSDELATAQRFLNGSRGETRDSSEAAKWLWRAVAKQNVTATLLLSDLYLRGDGVPHSCDQARLLLDAAARKGKAEAAARLRNLRAFGCE